jgi:glycosyltransferase involved in cell wall biosynthesis
MRLLFAVHGFVPEAVGGVELHSYHLASALAARHAVAVLARVGDDARPDYALEERRQGPLTVWRLNHRYTDLIDFAGIYRNTRIDEAFDRIVSDWEPDVVHVHHVIGLSTGMLERTKRRGVPLVLGLHDLWFGCPRGQRIRDDLAVCHEIDRRLCVECLRPQNYELRAARRPLGGWLRRLRWPTRRRGRRILRRYDADMHRVLALPDALIVPSAFHREQYRRYGVDPRAVHVIPYGLPRTAFANLPRPGGARQRIGFLGTLIPSKGPHVLLEAYRLLGRPEVALDFHGAWAPFHGDTGYLERLQAAAATIAGTVRFHGRYEEADVPRILSSLDVLVVPSLWYESYSIVIREGFLAGVPVVASGHGAMAEAIEHGVNGLLFRPGDAAELAAHLRRLLDDPALRRRLAARPPDVASIEENATRHERLYDALLARRGRAA